MAATYLSVFSRNGLVWVGRDSDVLKVDGADAMSLLATISLTTPSYKFWRRTWENLIGASPITLTEAQEGHTIGVDDTDMVFLPFPPPYDGMTYTIKHAGASALPNVTIDGNGNSFGEQSGAFTQMFISAQNGAMTVQWDEAQSFWWVI